jgi:hypothetical protein
MAGPEKSSTSALMPDCEMLRLSQRYSRRFLAGPAHVLVSIPTQRASHFPPPEPVSKDWTQKHYRTISIGTLSVLSLVQMIAPLTKLDLCSGCKRRPPDMKEQKWIDSIRERWGQYVLDQKFAKLVKFCVCCREERNLKGRRQGRQRSGPGWLRKPLKVIAVLAIKYPRLVTERKDNLKARQDLKLVTDWINGKRLKDDERRRVRYLTEFGDKEGQGKGVGSGSFLFQNFKLVISGLGETNLSELLDSPRIVRDGIFGPLLGLGKRKVPTGRAVAGFLRHLVHNPEIAVMLKTGAWLDLEPFGFDLYGKKQELYENHPEYQAVLDGIMDEYGYDECMAALQSQGFGPIVDWEEIEGMGEACDPEFEAAFYGDQLEEYLPEKTVHKENIFEHLRLSFSPHDLPSPSFFYEYQQIRYRCWRAIFDPRRPNPRLTLAELETLESEAESSREFKQLEAMPSLIARMIIVLKQWITLGCPSQGGTNS